MSFKQSRKFVVYLTMYSGNKLPKWYIGSSYKEKVLSGYNGSVQSKRFKNIYSQEQKENKHLFKTRIISYHLERKEALKEELRLHEKHLVKKNPKYINESHACINGFFGRDTSGELHPLFGRERTSAEKLKISSNHADVSGKNNPKALIILIFNEKDEIVFTTNGNFKQVCKENNLPFDLLKKSYQTGGMRLYERSNAVKYKSFKSWYAKIL